MLELTDYERHSPLWNKLEVECKAQIELAMDRLEHVKTIEEVMRLQGTIFAFRDILSASKKRTLIPTDPLGF